MTHERARFSKDGDFVATVREEENKMIVSAAAAFGWQTRHEIAFFTLTQRRRARQEAAADRDRLVARYERKLREIRDR